MKGPVQSLEVSYLLHATEDPSKVWTSVSDLLSVGATPVEDSLEGHFGNKITRVSVHLTGDLAMEAFRHTVSRMSTGLRRELLSGIREAMDEHQALFFRLDKQALVSGTMAFGSSDPVRFRVKPRLNVVRGDAAMFYEEALKEGR